MRTANILLAVAYRNKLLAEQEIHDQGMKSLEDYVSLPQDEFWAWIDEIHVIATVEGHGTHIAAIKEKARRMVVHQGLNGARMFCQFTVAYREHHKELFSKLNNHSIFETYSDDQYADAIDSFPLRGREAYALAMQGSIPYLTCAEQHVLPTLIETAISHLAACLVKEIQS